MGSYCISFITIICFLLNHDPTSERIEFCARAMIYRSLNAQYLSSSRREWQVPTADGIVGNNMSSKNRSEKQIHRFTSKIIPGVASMTYLLVSFLSHLQLHPNLDYNPLYDLEYEDNGMLKAPCCCQIISFNIRLGAKQPFSQLSPLYSSKRIE